MVEFSLLTKISSLEKQLAEARAMIQMQSEMLGSVTSSLQATFLLLIEKGIFDMEDDAKQFQRLYTSNLAKMDQTQAALTDQRRLV